MVSSPSEGNDAVRWVLPSGDAIKTLIVVTQIGQLFHWLLPAILLNRPHPMLTLVAVNLLPVAVSAPLLSPFGPFGENPNFLLSFCLIISKSFPNKNR